MMFFLRCWKGRGIQWLSQFNIGTLLKPPFVTVLLAFPNLPRPDEYNRYEAKLHELQQSLTGVYRCLWKLGKSNLEFNTWTFKVLWFEQAPRGRCMWELFSTTTPTRCLHITHPLVKLTELNLGRRFTKQGTGVQLWRHLARHQRQWRRVVAGCEDYHEHVTSFSSQSRDTIS